MALKMFTIRDSKVEGFMRPFFARTAGEAERMVRDEVNNPQADLSKHPEDFSLFELGEFDDSTGEIRPLSAPHHMALLVSYKKVDTGVRHLQSQLDQ